MQEYYYYNILRKTIIQFLDAFNGIKIIRYNKDGSFMKYVTVPLKLTAKQKQWYWITEQLKEKKLDEILPMMSVNMLSIMYDQQRQSNNLNSMTLSTNQSGGTVIQVPPPIPYNIQFTITVWSLYVSDVDQILEQILPYFAPYIMLKLYVPEFETSFDVKVLFEAATPENIDEYDDTDRRLIRWNIDFQVQTYMFKPIETSKIIRTIFINEYTDEDQWNARDTTSTFTSGASAGEAKRLKTYSPWVSAGNPLYTYELYTS